jgi:long-chain acyl-CoA synthetase
VSINVAQREALLPTEPDRERILAITPLFHVYAVAMGLYLAAYCRGTLFIMPRYRPELALAAIDRERITLLSGSPTIYEGLMAHERFGETDLTTLRLCFSGTSALSEETLRRWEAATGCPICEGYGQSEAGPVLSFNPRHGRRKAGSVGVAVPATDIEIVDTASGTRVLGAGEAGEIRARGPQIMHGYRGLARETGDALRDGWLYTGDIGELDVDGYLFIRDRKKDMVIVSGFNVYPREIEEVLYSHPAVLEAAVVGVPDAYRGEALVGFVVPAARATLAAESLRDYMAERLVSYKIPQDIRIVASLPRTTVGKVDKKVLRIAGIEAAGRAGHG